MHKIIYRYISTIIISEIQAHEYEGERWGYMGRLRMER